MTPTKDLLEIIARAEDKGARVDQFLAAKLLDHSRSSITKLIKAGSITRNGEIIKPSQIVVGDETFVLTRPEKKPTYIEAQNIPVEILYSDDDIAVINKPAGLVVHPGAGVKDGTLCNALVYQFPAMSTGVADRPGIVHRLDKETSGLLVVAKTEKALRVLSQDFKERRVKKVYRAFCVGEIAAKSFELKTGHVRHPRNRLKFFTGVHATSHCTGVRLAHTSFTVLQTKYGISVLEVHLHTGRTHQIRAHLADIDHPLLGDELYGGKRNITKAPPELKAAVANLTGQALHAQVLCFTHPITGEALSFTAPLPKNLEAIAQYLG